MDSIYHTLCFASTMYVNNLTCPQNKNKKKNEREKRKEKRKEKSFAIWPESSYSQNPLFIILIIF